MKTTLAAVSCFLATAVSLLAQAPTTNNTAADAAPLTNAPTANGQQLTNAPAADEGDTNKVDIAELMKLPAFTNDTGMIMVKLSDALWVSAYETTQEHYQKIAGSNPSKFPGPRNPVDSVSWNDAMDFCVKLTAAENEKKMLPEKFVYGLPTQAQWDALAAGADLKDAVTSSGTTRSSTAPVGSLGATGPGIYDIRGNVCEWCLDPQDMPYRVARGASWQNWIEINLRPEFRWYEAPEVRKETIGFRVVLELRR
ncbi:MAG TPA: SUMF1/EgtB/PvdO family nonheme iron enzyme [Verrucomicrobiae bacterium]|nr:SUMF1/EgtB/PvdO family nonheme iron enzyme [Verrucomicrobiae bacterium]